MARFRNLIFLSILLAGVWHGADSWSVGKVVGDLPLDVIEDILTILVFGTVHVAGDCSNANNVSQVHYCLFNSQHPNNSVNVTSPDQIDPTKPVIVLIHGWGGNCDVDYINVIKNGYLKSIDANVISVDYSVYAAANYQTSYCHVPAIGKNIAQFLCNLSKAQNIDLASIHVVGHSLGGHVAGFTGKNTQKICGSIGRITALDPAGPLYQNVDSSQRLYKTDGIFVDVIHTNEGQFGYVGDCGDVDFYPNCGYRQKGCKKLDINITEGIGGIVKIPLTYIDCNHQRSCYLFAESINNNSFQATNCLLCGTRLCTKNPLNPDYTYMGESCRSPPKNKEYNLNTNGNPPYALGPEGPLKRYN